MSERDWLGELSEAMGEPAPTPEHAPLQFDQQTDISAKSPGRDLDGWAEELAEAFGDQLGTAAPDAQATASAPSPVAAPPVTPSPAAAGTPASTAAVVQASPAPGGGATAAVPGEVPVDAAPPATALQGAVPQAWDPTVAVPAPAPATTPEVLNRLARLEMILDADLDKLGPAVLAESIAGLDEQVRALQDRLAQVDVRAASGPVPAGAGAGEQLAPLQEVVAGVAAQLASLQGAVARLDERVLAQSRFLDAAVRPEATSAAGSVDAVLSRLDELGRRLDAIVAAKERDGGKVVVDADQFARSLNSLGRRIVALEQLHSDTIAMDQRAEERMRELIERLDRLTAGLLG